MPFSMITIKGSLGTVDRADIEYVGQGAKAFMNDIKPHALGHTNAKELILKDADYSTPQDHYFMYVNRNKAKMDAMGFDVDDVNEDLGAQELRIINELYSDQNGRAEAIENHISMLREKRKPQTMMELYNNLKPNEIKEIEANWGTTLENLKKNAIAYDKKEADKAIPSEEKRSI